MKTVKATAILLFGPFLGLLIALVLAAFALPPQSLEGGRAPGDDSAISLVKKYGGLQRGANFPVARHPLRGEWHLI